MVRKHIDINNDHAVGLRDDQVVIAVPVAGTMTRPEALRLAAWLAAVADPGQEEFGEVLEAVLHS